MSMSNVNVVVITGNLTRDPELRHLGSGTAVCKLRVAVNSRRKDSQTGEWVDKPNYFDVTVWGKSGENAANYLAKGRPVAVEGRLDWREWEDQGGNKRQAVEIIANTVQYGPKPQGSGSGSSETATDNSPQEEMATEVEIRPIEDELAAEAEKEEEEIPF